MLYNLVTVQVPITDTVILGGNMRRKALVMSVDGSGTVTFNIGRPALLNGNGFGFQLNNTMLPLRFNEEDYGQAIREEIHAVAGSGTATVTVIEFFGP